MCRNIGCRRRQVSKEFVLGQLASKRKNVSSQTVETCVENLLIRNDELDENLSENAGIPGTYVLVILKTYHRSQLYKQNLARRNDIYILGERDALSPFMYDSAKPRSLKRSNRRQKVSLRTRSVTSCALPAVPVASPKTWTAPSAVSTVSLPWSTPESAL